MLLWLRLATRQCELSRTSLDSSPHLLLSLCPIKACRGNIWFYFLQQALCAEGKYYAVTNDLHSMTCVCRPRPHLKSSLITLSKSLFSDAIMISQEQMLTLSITIAALVAFSFLDIRLQIWYSFARVAPSLVKLFVLLWIIFRPIVKPNRVEEEKFPLPQGQLLASTTLPLFWGLL